MGIIDCWNCWKFMREVEAGYHCTRLVQVSAEYHRMSIEKLLGSK